MTIEMNTQVMQLWREQSRMQEQTPEMAAAQLDGVNAWLQMLHEQADDVTRGQIHTVYSTLQGIMAMIACQAMTIASAGMIIPALKIQRDEMALEVAKLLELMALTESEGSPIAGLIAGLYEGWREMLGTEDIKADSQEELLDAIKGDIEQTWGLGQGGGQVVLAALRGHIELEERQMNALYRFLETLGGDE